MSKMFKYGQDRAKNKRLIQKKLDELGLDSKAIAKLAGVCSQTVYSTLNGHIHSQKVLNTLRDAGVPENLLSDPRKERTMI